MGSGSNIGRVRGLGSAKHGGEHWLKQRTTAVSNLLLTIWLVVSLILMPNFEQATLAQCSASLPSPSLLLRESPADVRSV